MFFHPKFVTNMVFKNSIEKKCNQEIVVHVIFVQKLCNLWTLVGSEKIGFDTNEQVQNKFLSVNLYQEHQNARVNILFVSVVNL